MVAAADCAYLRKPVNVDQLTRRVENLLDRSLKTAPGPRRASQRGGRTGARSSAPHGLCRRRRLGPARDHARHASGPRPRDRNPRERRVLSFGVSPRPQGLPVVDSMMPGTSGLELLQLLKAEGRELPSIVITGNGDIAMAIKAMKAGAMDFSKSRRGRTNFWPASIARSTRLATPPSGRARRRRPRPASPR